MRHKVADLNGPVHYIDFGGTGQPVVMVHGLAGSAINWMAVGPQIAKTHGALAIDLAGFGQTPLFGRSATVGANAQLVHDFAEKVVGEPVILMGNSMGGHIAVLEAAAHPEWVTSIVLVDPAIPGSHVSRPEPPMLALIAALSCPGSRPSSPTGGAESLDPRDWWSALSRSFAQTHRGLTRRSWRLTFS